MLRISVSPSWATITGADEAHISDLLFSAPEPPFKPGGNYLKACPANLLFLEQRYPGESAWHDPHNKLYEAKAYRFLSKLRDREITPAELDFPFKVKPDPWQVPVFAYGRAMANIALAPAALGTGKTKMALDIAAAKFLDDKIDGVIIIAPNGVHRQWISKAIPVHMSDAVPVRCHIWSPTRKIPANWPLDVRSTFRLMRVMTFNVEAFSTESGKAYKALMAILRTGRWLLIVDESTRVKNGRAQRTRVILKLARFAAARMILTGTPVTKGLEDFYTQYGVLDPAIIGLSSYTAFRNRYCVTIPAYRGAAQGAVKIIGYKNKEELFRKLAPVTFMIGREVLGLGEPIRETREVPLGEEQEAIYNAMAARLVEALQSRRITTPANTLVELLRLQQVLCGQVFETVIEDGVERQEPRNIPTLRPRALMQALNEIDGQVVIWARFQHDIDLIRKAIEDQDRARMREGREPLGCVTYDGRVTSVIARESAIDSFAKGEVQYFIGNQAAGGTGIDGLQERCSTAIYYSNSFNREHRWQSEGRIYRRGQTAVGRVTYLDLIVPGSVDELFLDAIAATEELANMVLRNPSMLTGGLK